MFRREFGRLSAIHWPGEAPTPANQTPRPRPLATCGLPVARQGDTQRRPAAVVVDAVLAASRAARLTRCARDTAAPMFVHRGGFYALSSASASPATRRCMRSRQRDV